MEQHEKIFRRRLYVVAACSGCVMSVAAWLFVEGILKQAGFLWAALICMAAMYVAFYLVIRTFRRSAKEFRAEQIAKGISVGFADRERYVKGIRSMKKMIALFGIFLIYGIFATRGEAMWPRMEGLSITVFILSACIYYLFWFRKKLKSLSEENKGPSME